MYRSCLGGLLPCLLCACEAIVGSYKVEKGASTPDAGSSSLIDSSALCETESELFAFDLNLDSDSALDSLEAYYERQNPDLVEHLAELAGMAADRESHVGVSYLLGAAGVGKSFLTRNSLDAFTDPAPCEIELGDVFDLVKNPYGLELESLPDLATLDGDIVFNKLPGMSPTVKLELLPLLEAAGCVIDGQLTPLIVIDGIDEIHDNTAHDILESVDNLLLNGDERVGPFLHFLVVGRPGGFAAWLTDPERNEENTALTTDFSLAPPRYVTAGDLEFRVMGYLDFIGMLEDMTQSEVSEYVASFTAAVSRFPFLTYSIGNLSLGNAVVEQTAPGLDESEEELKDGLFDGLLLRNAETHGRPGADSMFETVYRRLLEEIAARHTDLDDRGAFRVLSEDKIDLSTLDSKVHGEVRVRDVLNRAGIAFLTNANATTVRYRFEPFWVHAHLIQRYNRRMKEDYTYQGCSASDQ